MSERLLAKTLAIAIFLGTSGSLLFGQSANNCAASTYKTNCVSCHGQDGRGSALGKSLHAADFHSAQVQQQSDPQLADVVAEGRGNMPAFATRLSKDQIDALVKYIRSLARANSSYGLEIRKVFETARPRETARWLRRCEGGQIFPFPTAKLERNLWLRNLGDG